MLAPPSAPAARSTRCWTLQTAAGACDVAVEVTDEEPLAAVLGPIAALLGVARVQLWAGDRRLPDDLTMHAPELRHGAFLGVDAAAPSGRAVHRSSALRLHVVGGPRAGRTAPLVQGTHVLGRGAAATLVIEDPDVSRRHAVVRVAGGGITVADLGSTNGSWLDGDELDGTPRSWKPGARLRLGASTVTVTGPTSGPAAVEAIGGGLARLTPAARVPTADPEAEVEFPAGPAPLPPRRLAWAAVALPAVGGVLMAVLLHSPTFLFFAALSPVVAVGTWLSDRWTGRRDRRQALTAHAVALAEAERRLEEAVRRDRRALERAHPDLAELADAAQRWTTRLWVRTTEDPDAMTVRLGCGAGATRVTRVDPNGQRARASAEGLPVVLDLRRTEGLGVVGPRRRTVGALATVVAQLAALHPPGDVDLALLTDAAGTTDWSWARWLPHLAPERVWADADGDAPLRALLAARRAATAPGDTAGTWLVVLVDRPLDRRLAAELRAAREFGVRTLCCAASEATLPLAGGALLRVIGETGLTGTLTREGAAEPARLSIDLLDPVAGARLARDLAALRPPATAGSLPDRVRLLDLPGPGLRLGAAGTVDGQWSRARDRLAAAIGGTADGPFLLDLCRSGPHGLVAGTTGSGKSELLRTLIAGLAANHPPDRCSFLLVDYKGGAAFAEAAELPHTVGLLTDLDGRATARALRSLASELTRREALLARHGVTDLVDLPDDADLARLVIVVDEFATLAEELPAFVPGLIGIAQRGRSLGVHLILATQRPSGVVSPEIRANCTLRICLRTTDDADSRDILGSPAAAHLPLDRPGRAFVRTGSGVPTAVQVARVSTGPEVDTGPRARRWNWPPGAAVPLPEQPPPSGTDLRRLVTATRELADRSGLRPPHRPWCPPLPDRLDAAGLQGAPIAPDLLRIGLLDRPENQSREPLVLDLSAGGCWLAVGGPGSGRTTLLRAVLGEAVRGLPPDRLHVHVLDPGGGTLAAEVAALPHAGTCVAGEDALRTVRLVERLAQEVAARRAGGGAPELPRLLLLVDGAESVMTQLEDGDPGQGSATFLRLLRDAAAAGLTCVVTTDRAIPGGRLAAAARHRLVLPLGDAADYAVAGIRPTAVPAHRPPGRALVGEEGVECQLMLPVPLPDPIAPPGALPNADGRLRIVELPADPAAPLPRLPASPAGVERAGETAGSLDLIVGPGGDEGNALRVDLVRAGGLLVVGAPGTGRSSALDAFGRHLAAAGVRLLRLGRHRVPGPPPATDGEEWRDPADTAGLAAWLDGLGGSPAVLIADDVGAPADWAALGELGGRLGDGTVAVLVAGTAADLSGHYQGPVAALRRRRTGLLLCPGPGDADLLGIRLPRTPVPVRPGSGWLVVGGSPARVQVARLRTPTGLTAGVPAVRDLP